MAITITDVLNMHAFVPNPDYGNPYPVGIWKAARTQVTDASGGLVRWTVAPQSAAQAAKFLWSLEEFHFITSVSTADIGIYTEVSTGEVVSRAGGTEIIRLSVSMSTSHALFATRLASMFSGFKDQMRFIHQPGGGNLNQYIMEANNLNGQVFTMAFWGYFWNSDARRLASGPRKP